jgi:serine/threonine-protein kinase RsbW
VDRLRVPAVIDSMDDVARYVRELALRAGLCRRRTGHLRLAAEELVANVIVHGYGPRGAPACTVEIEGGIDGDRVWLGIIDDAPPFDPTQVPDPADLPRPLTERTPGGLGLYLARSAVDGMAYESVGGRNRVVVTVHRADPPGHPVCASAAGEPPSA